MMIPYSDANIPLLIHIRLADLFTFEKMWGIDVFAYEKLVSHVTRRLRRVWVWAYGLGAELPFGKAC
jgi:hypothetical protein